MSDLPALGGESQPEPTDAEVEAWLRRPEGQAAMMAVMEKVLAGEFGEVPEQMMAMAREGLKRHHSRDVLAEVQQRMANLQRLGSEEPQGSAWAHVRDLNEELKGMMDLLLEVHEPHRSILMSQCLPLQQQMEDLQKQL